MKYKPKAISKGNRLQSIIQQTVIAPAALRLKINQPAQGKRDHHGMEKEIGIVPIARRISLVSSKWLPRMNVSRDIPHAKDCRVFNRHNAPSA
jgi:hypothetical protein